MSTSRRNFLRAASVAAGAGALSASSPRQAWADPAGSREPAPVKPPPSGDVGLLAGSPLLDAEALATAAIDAALKAGASYADARLVSWRRESLSVRDEHIRNVRRTSEFGLGLRVIADGAWGFAATHRVAPASKTAVETMQALAKQAVGAAKINAALRAQPVELAPMSPLVGQWVAPHGVDPFTVSPKDKADVLIAATKAALAVPGVLHATAGVQAQREEKLFLSSEGARIHQLMFRILPSLSAMAVSRRLGRFASRNHEIAPMLAGWEHVTDAKLDLDAPQIGEDAVRKLHAEAVEPGEQTVILAPSNLWLTIHESIGHPTELDRALGLEANYAGTSFMDPAKTGSLELGGEPIDFIADRTQPGGLATCAWDDDGAATERWDLVKDGKLVDWQTTRDQAHWIRDKTGDKDGHACSYGDSYASVAFQRMPNISLMPGKEGYTTEDLINATEDGILISGRGSWSIDHQRYNFQFSGQQFWKIEKGRLARPLRDVAYQANTVDFWKSCDMLGGEGSFRLGGSFGDGKGEPGQRNAVSHGCPPARFRVNVVNTGENS
ncbi:Twin-arginine translocation pathway signal [Plesiocystis pacifica SIR-1]|uniref:Twin-arginine translocation pathway signal n=1 Tax=Plesiocystis pacifica SIR-1 TaxID=391625 RepID=A6FWW7_9BACT|nr:TldD/PmbA family protein [Plesiocystis pacifica]EDM81791.1 Twin-arginine translocation pathway signal [Plesiocystis pacifica SIR-1]